MTNELEKQFFNTFNIEPIGCNDNKNCTGVLDCTQCPNAKYPQITDHILLEMIIILGTICTVFDKNVDDLKENVLKNLIEFSGRYLVYNQVRTLFEEG